MSNQNINRTLPTMTAEAYFKHKEIIEAFLQGADVEYLDQEDTWCWAPGPAFNEKTQYRIKPANIKKYIVVGFDGDDSHHTNGVWSNKVEKLSPEDEEEMKYYNQQRTLIELEINPSNGKVVAAKVIE